jgi:hypothetical protein
MTVPMVVAGVLMPRVVIVIMGMSMIMGVVMLVIVIMQIALFVRTMAVIV